MYDFDAGDLSLNFANTQDWHASGKPVENLNSYSELITWGEQAGLVSPKSAHLMNRLAIEQPADASDEYKFTLQVREALYRVFAHRYAGEPILEDDLVLLNSVISQAMAHMQLSPAAGEIHWEWSPEINGANLILWPVARAAAELLTSDKASKVRICEDDRGCGYLFIDQTKNHSRRWCSMESCGNRAKARRHYSRLQAG
jgi:predicted RNA-binding Zn ribbon-like protein